MAAHGRRVMLCGTLLPFRSLQLLFKSRRVRLDRTGLLCRSHLAEREIRLGDYVLVYVPQIACRGWVPELTENTLHTTARLAAAGTGGVHGTIGAAAAHQCATIPAHSRHTCPARPQVPAYPAHPQRHACASHGGDAPAHAPGECVGTTETPTRG